MDRRIRFSGQLRGTRPAAAVRVLLLLIAQLGIASAEDTSPAEISITEKLPYGHKEVDYFAKVVNDPVARLQTSIQSGDVRLQGDSRHGFLKSVLKHLHVPLESQLLVFSKTARSPNLVSPAAPRAVFFNDMVSVAWIPEARELELTAIDPTRGVNFYTLTQPLQEAEDSPPTFQRTDRCLACHSGRSSLDVPGLLLRGFQTDRTGKMLFGFSRVTHDMTYDRRWGGWYVTGSPAGLLHRGNLAGDAENEQHKSEPGFLSSLNDLKTRGDFSAWPAQASDFVAHLVLSHQAHGINLLIRVGLEARLNRKSDAEDRLIRYLVFADEPALNLTRKAAQACRERPYATWFEGTAKRTADGASLRQFDLTKRLFRNRLSYLVNTPLFDGLPSETRKRLLLRLWRGLTHIEPKEAFRHLERDEKARIIKIVRATKENLPAPWLPDEE